MSYIKSKNEICFHANKNRQVMLVGFLFKPNGLVCNFACPIVILFSLLFGEAKRSEESQTKRDFSFRICFIQNDKAFQLSFFIMLSPVAALWYKT